MQTRLIFLLIFVPASGCRLVLPDIAGAGDGSTGDAAVSDASVVLADRSVTDEDANPTPDSAVPIDASVDASVPVDASMDASSPDAGLVCPPTGPMDCAFQERACVGNPASTCYMGTVQQAVQKVINDYPSWFEWSDVNSCYVILAVDSYMDEVVINISSHDLCAIRDPYAPGEEVTVKHDIAFSENFDIVASNGCARYGSAIFTGTCAPSWW